MPKRLICPAVEQVAWQDYQEPASLEGTQVRVRFEYGVEKHGTMMAFYKGYGNRRGAWDYQALIHRPEGVLWEYPIPLGNMQFGQVVEAGPAVSHLQEGDRVYFSSPFQPTAVVDESVCRILKEGISWKSAMLLDPAEFALGVVRDGHVRAGDSVAVFGLGAIGLVAVQFARIAGALKTFAIDPLPNRRAAASQLGSDQVIDPTDEDVGLILRERTGGRGVDVVIDFSGSQHALQAGLRGVAYGGTIVCGAFPPPYGGGLDFGGEAHMNRPTIVFSRACSDPNPDHPRWNHPRIQDACQAFIEKGLLNGEPIITPVVKFDDLPEEYPRIATEPQNNIKLAVEY